MFLTSLINAKFNLITGMTIGAWMAIILREMCKKKPVRSKAYRNTT